MDAPLVTKQLTKCFGPHVAINSLSLEIPANRIVGLLGRNGAGKTTLLNLACGLLLPTAGVCTTLDQDASKLDRPELTRLGFVPQESRLLEWMTVQQQIDFHASFYPIWDRAREARLLRELELNPTRKIVQLSTGDRQKLGIILGVCHRPKLLLLDEPVSALDPIVRGRMLTLLVDMIAEDESTIVISSHILSDIERIVDWVVCLDGGSLVLSQPLDELQESYAEWILSSPTGRLPKHFSEPWILSQSGDTHRSRLVVNRPAGTSADEFVLPHQATIESRPLSLEEIFPLLVPKRKAAA